MAPPELQRFFEEIVGTLRSRGAVAAITSGLACVYYGIAESTKDCDLLCHPQAFENLLDFLEHRHVQGIRCTYRGNISPPLDWRWHAGGWTSHFEWPLPSDALLLDVFGRALRQSSPWEQDLAGLYVGPHTIATMKRTARDKDWPFVTALGIRMIESGDDRGWLHIFNPDVLKEMLGRLTCPEYIAAQRPPLLLALQGDPRLPGALNAERKLWEELDRRRIQIMEHSLRPYVAAVRKARPAGGHLLREDHQLRTELATTTLPMNPIGDYGVENLLNESRESLFATGLVPENAAEWLPDLGKYFRDL